MSYLLRFDRHVNIVIWCCRCFYRRATQLSWPDVFITLELMFLPQHSICCGSFNSVYFFVWWIMSSATNNKFPLSNLFINNSTEDVYFSPQKRSRRSLVLEWGRDLLSNMQNICVKDKLTLKIYILWLIFWSWRKYYAFCIFMKAKKRNW